MVRLSHVLTRRGALCLCLKLIAGFILQLGRVAAAQLPVLVTQTPITGNSGDAFFVFLPIANSGKSSASDIHLTSVSLTHMGSAAGTLILPAKLPFVPGSGYLGPGGIRTLDLEFRNSALISGNTYLVNVDGTYELKGKTYTFALSRPVGYAKGFSGTHEQLTEIILTKFDARARVDPLVDDEAIQAFVKELPQVQSVDLQVNPPLVEITFTGGWQPLTLLNNVKLPPQPAINAAAASRSEAELSEDRPFPPMELAPNSAGISPATELPLSIQVRTLNALGSGFPTAMSDIQDWLSRNGYRPVKGADATEQGLRNVGGDGVFYISTHAWGTKSTFYLWTATPWEQACDPNNLSSHLCSDPTLTADIGDHLAKHVAADNRYDEGIQDWRVEDHLAINAAFVDAYWHDFGANALVYIDACDSALDSAPVKVFRDELLHEKGASVLVGWTGTVGDIANDTARLVFDRLLGANKFCPEDGAYPCHAGPAVPPVFPQRPFDYRQVENDLPLHHLGTDGPLSELTFELNTEAPGFGLLAPSIAHMDMDEGLTTNTKSELTIHGIFGGEPGSVIVGGEIDTSSGVPILKGGEEVKIQSWPSSGDQIVVKLPLSGPGSAGNVQVVVRNHFSNIAQLTEWRSQSNQVTFMLEGGGSLQQMQKYALHLRADIRQWRKAIHEKPSEPQGTNIFSANDSTGTMSSSGSVTLSDGTSVKWGGSDKLMNLFSGSPYLDFNSLLFFGYFVDSRHLQFSINAVSGQGQTNSICPPGSACTTIPLASFGPDTWFEWWTNNVVLFEAELDGSASIIGNAARGQGPSNFIWPFLTASGTVTWTTIPSVSGTAPDPDSAR